MGGIVDSLFGGSKQQQTQTSSNQAFGELKNLLSGNIGQGNSAMSQIAALLGIGGDPAAASSGYKNYLNSTGYNAMMDAGSKAITGNAAAKGLLNSGSTAKALTTFGQNLGKQSFNDYLGQLTGLGNYGLQSANTLAGAGQQSTGSSSGYSKGGIINSLFSDARLKQNIKLRRRTVDGVGVYSYEYRDQPGVTHIGVLAQEIAVLRPEALGPMRDGFMTVRYDLLKEAA